MAVDRCGLLAALALGIWLSCAIGADPAEGSLQARRAREPLADLAKNARARGDAGRGAVLFFQPFLTCARWCHDAEAGTQFGPDLSRAEKGDAVIRGKAGPSEIVITTTRRLAGAIHSLTWNGKEFIDSFDHGRQLQSAANFDAGTPFTPETFNPTEAGSRADGRGATSSSRLLHLVARDHELQTTTRMAFWLKPGEKSDGHPAKNTTVLSDHLVTKRVRIGWRDLPHVLDYRVTFSVPVGERHTYAQFEAVTGYLPPEFERFWKYNPAEGQLEPLTDGPGEQPWPVVLATATGSHAMGVYSPDQPSAGYETAGYGRFRFAAEKVNKWNCVFRLRDSANGIAPGEYSFRTFVIVGDLETVRGSLRTLHRAFRKL